MKYWKLYYEILLPADSLVHFDTKKKFYALLTVHLSMSLDNDQLDAHLLYFIVHYNPLRVSEPVPSQPVQRAATD
jgi:hypothetical protein